jgi:uncharacterized Zn finger protein (UPF0148 family)
MNIFPPDPFCANRKAVATKVLGVKIMQGYSLLEKQCSHCTMPLTEYKGSIDCFVCPVLEKKVAKSQQQRRLLESEMSRVKLETQLLAQRKMVQANKNRLLEKTKKLGKPSSVSSSSVVSAKANSSSCDPKIKEDRAEEHATTLVQENTMSNENNISDNKDVSEMHSAAPNAGDLQRPASNSTPAAQGTGNLKSLNARDGGNLCIITSQSNITLKATNSTPAAEGNNNLKSPVTSDGAKATPTSLIRSKTEESNQSKTIVKAVNTMSTSDTSRKSPVTSDGAKTTPTSLIRSKTEESNQSKTIVKAVNTMSTSDTSRKSPVTSDGATATPTSLIRSKTEESNQSKTIVKAVNTMSTSDTSSKASNKSKLVVQAQSVLSTTTAASSVPSHRSKVVVKANSLLSAATVASTQGSSRSNVIRIDSLLNKTTMPCSPARATSSPASAHGKTAMMAGSLAGGLRAVSTKASASPASANSTTGVKASSLVGAQTAVSTKERGSDQALDDTNTACKNDVTEKVSEIETKSAVDVPPPVKSEEAIQSSEPPQSKESGVSSSEKKSEVLGLRHGASVQLAGVTTESTIESPKSSPEGGASLGSSKEHGASEGSQGSEGSHARPRERGQPIRPVMALVKVTPQPAPAQRKKKKNAVTKFAISTMATTPQASPPDPPEASGHPEQKLHSAPQPSEDSSKFSSAHSDSTISTKSKMPRPDRNVAVVEHHKEAEAESKMKEKVSLAIGPADIRSFPSDDSSEKNLSIATPTNPVNCMTAMFNAAIGTVSADDDSIIAPTQHELHKLNLEEIRHLKEAIQAEKVMQEHGIEQTTAATEQALIEAKQSHPKVKSPVNVKGDIAKIEASKELTVANDETPKSAAKRMTCAKVSLKSPEKAQAKQEDAHEVVVAPGENKRDEVEQGTSTKQGEKAPETKIKRNMEKSVKRAPETTEDEKSPKSTEKEESTEQSLPEKIGALAKAIAEADKTAIAEAESDVAPETMEEEKSPKSNATKQFLAEKIGALAKAIAEADKTAIAEAESIVRSFAEDYHDDQSRSSSLEEIRRQQWETLRSEGRAAITRRSMTGWTVSSEFCRGKECESSPLVVKGSTKQCVVCGGTGTGHDGVYDLSDGSETSKKENFASNDTSSEAPVIRPPRFDFNTSINLKVVKPPLSSPLNEAPETDTEIVSKALIRPPRIRGIIPRDSDSEEGIPVTKLASLHLVKSPLRFPSGPAEVRMVAINGQPDFNVVDGKEARDSIESKRTIVSKEIGKRMLQGWKLLNLTCPTCLMPLMIDENDEHEICVLCGLVTEGLHSTGTASTMQPTLSFKSTEDNESGMVSPLSFTAHVPMNHNETEQNEGIDSAQKPDETLTEICHKESRKLPQRSPRKSSAESPRKSSKESSRKQSKKSHKKSSHRSSKDKTISGIAESQEGGSPHKAKKSGRKSSKEETVNETPGDANPSSVAQQMSAKSSPSPFDYLMLEPGQDLPSIGRLAERIRYRANTPKSDPPADRGHNVVRKSMLEADAMKAGEVVKRFDITEASPVAADTKACGPSPSTIKTFDCDPPKENLVTAEVATPFAAHKACGPSPSMKHILYCDQPQDKKKPDASADTYRVEPSIHARSPSIDPESSVGGYSEQPSHELLNYCGSPDYEEILTLEIPKGFDVSDETALRQLIAQAKVCHPAKYSAPGVEQSQMINQDARWGCHLPSPGLTASPPGSLRVDIIDTMTEQQHSEPTMTEGSYRHMPSPGISTASLPLKSPASYRPPRSTAAPQPLLVVHTSRSQLRPRITPESMDRTRPSSRSRASCRSRMSSVGEDSDSSSFDYVHMYSHSHSQQSETSRIPIAPPGAYSSYRVEKPSPESPEIIVIGGPQQPVITMIDDLISLGLKSLAATSVADSISTAALDALLARIEQTKYKLDAAGDEPDGVEKQEKIAGLLQELSSAAAQMEMLDDPTSCSSAASCSSSSGRGFRESL